MPFITAVNRMANLTRKDVCEIVRGTEFWPAEYTVTDGLGATVTGV